MIFAIQQTPDQRNHFAKFRLRFGAEAARSAGMFVLGFTDEDVTGGWQHWRLATEFGAAFEADHLPASYGVVEAPGEGRFLVQWYLRADAAAVLDRHNVGWRRFLIGRADHAPAGARTLS
jgi:hypothetical protein